MFSGLRAIIALLVVLIPSQLLARTYVYDYVSREVTLDGVVQDSIPFLREDSFFLRFEVDGWLSGDNWVEFDTITEASTRISLDRVYDLDVNGGFPLKGSYYGSDGLCCTKPVRDSPCESSAITGGDEQTDTPDLQDQELAGLQRSAQAPGFVDGLVRPRVDVGGQTDWQARSAAHL